MLVGQRSRLQVELQSAAPRKNHNRKKNLELERDSEGRHAAIVLRLNELATANIFLSLGINDKIPQKLCAKEKEMIKGTKKA